MLQDPLMTMIEENLAAIVAEVRTVTPSAGESLVTGSLRSQGYLASYPGRSLIKKTAWQLIRVQTVDFRCPGVGSTNQISERFT